MNAPYKMKGTALYGKIKGIDGKACWKGYRYAGTEDGKDKCVPMRKKAKPCPGCSTICPSCKSGYPKTMAKKRGCGYKR